MTHIILRLTDPRTGETGFVLWSTVCDALASGWMDLRELRDLAQEQALRAGVVVRDGPEERYENHQVYLFESAKNQRSIGRAQLRGTSYLDRDITGEQVVEGNRAGPNESCLSLTELIDLAKKERES